MVAHGERHAFERRTGGVNRRTGATSGSVADICVAGTALIILDADGQLSRLKQRFWYAMERLDLTGKRFRL